MSEDRAASRLAAIKELASVISNQRHEIERLHWKADYAEERYKTLRASIEALDLTAHADACHISTCPEEDGCELRDASYLGSYMSHDCSCGLDKLRSALNMSTLIRKTEAESQAYHRKQMEEAAKLFRPA